MSEPEDSISIQCRDAFYEGVDKGYPRHWRDIGPDEIWDYAWQACAERNSKVIEQQSVEISGLRINLDDEISSNLGLREINSKQAEELAALRRFAMHIAGRYADFDGLATECGLIDENAQPTKLLTGKIE